MTFQCSVCGEEARIHKDGEDYCEKHMPEEDERYEPGFLVTVKATYIGDFQSLLPTMEQINEKFNTVGYFYAKHEKLPVKKK